ncbi:hypothetical protein BpHYR1_031339 [Brachionus plicatilis]|uniref:Uncharacterized protein n=1 Tax=Brachionus plicatilis TaxID=10195 RepID=A0A3M7SDH1_BRAPC|nr:hypothetical protein BpHYR1_031339 [Brachionus plicatilis]
MYISLIASGLMQGPYSFTQSVRMSGTILSLTSSLSSGSFLLVADVPIEAVSLKPIYAIPAKINSDAVIK